MRLDVGGLADRHPLRRHDGRRDPERGPGRRGQERRHRGRRDALPRGQAHRLQHLKVGHPGRDVPGHVPADEEQSGQQCGQPEGQQARRLVLGEPLDRPAEVGLVVPHVDVGPACRPGQIGPERGNLGGPALQPYQRVDVRVTVGAHDVLFVLSEQGRRDQHAAVLARPVHVHAAPEGPAHPDDGGRDLGAGGRPARAVVAPILVDLRDAGQIQGQRVPDMLVVDGLELGRHHDLVHAFGVVHPPGEHDGPLDGGAHLVVDRGEACAGIRTALQREPEHDRKLGQRLDLGQGPDLVPVEARLVGQHGHGPGQGLVPQPVGRAVPPAGPRRRREHRRRGHRHQQGQHGQRPPVVAHLQAQPGQNNSHRS